MFTEGWVFKANYTKFIQHLYTRMCKESFRGFSSVLNLFLVSKQEITLFV